jgi:hypothetical protein
VLPLVVADGVVTVVDVVVVVVVVVCRVLWNRQQTRLVNGKGSRFGKPRIAFISEIVWPQRDQMTSSRYLRVRRRSSSALNFWDDDDDREEQRITSDRLGTRVQVLVRVSADSHSARMSSGVWN